MSGARNFRWASGQGLGAGLGSSLCALCSLSVLLACGSTSENALEAGPGNGAESPDDSGGPGDGDSGKSSGASSGVLGAGDGDEVDPEECRRVVSLEDVTLSTPPPFDVMIIADNSESLSWSREDLAQGLSDLVANVHGHDVRFHVLTPTQYGVSNADIVDLETGEPLVKWQDPVSLEPYTDAITRYVQTCTDELGQELVCPDYPVPKLEFELEGHWEFVMPEPVAELRSDMTADELDTERAKVVEAILGLGIGGATEEQPLCSLMRYLKLPEAALPERAVFVVIADEDDTSSATDCLESYEFFRKASERTTRTYGCEQDCDGFDYRVTRVASRNTLSFSCAPVDDFGELAPMDTWQDKTMSRSISDGCEGGASRSCTAEEEEIAGVDCKTGDSVQDCIHLCEEDATNDVCGIAATDPNVDYCTQAFESGTTSYDNFSHFCEIRRKKTGWGDCTRNGFTVDGETTAWTGYGTRRPVAQAKSVAALVHLFHAEAVRIFGEENYFVESIVFSEGDSCTPEAGQSVATELMNIASSPEQVYPICESYAPALMHVNQFAQELLQTEYSVELTAGESIESVTVESRDGTSRQLSPEDYQHFDATSLLQIDREALRSSDFHLSVELVDPCVPVIR